MKRRIHARFPGTGPWTRRSASVAHTRTTVRRTRAGHSADASSAPAVARTPVLVVFSRTLERADWADSRIARGDLAEEMAALKREPGKDMLAWGGAAFAQSLSRLGLVDEYRLIHQPVALGDGLPLFKDLSAPLRLELVDATTYPTGAALHFYRPAAAS
jgi:dihydrofolate reductase